ncbi:MAG: uncharacterized protein QG653_293 [Patescibacteria group bacterium]|nr:uncharacterized protein [Patescibacteria group bacterium]
MKKHIANFFRKHKQSSIFVSIFVAVVFSFMYLPQCLTQKVCGVTYINSIVRDDVVIMTPRGEINAEVVDTFESRELGLSRRNGLREGEGMLFVFPFPGKYGFWMKDMKFPIDIIWINGQGVVVHVVENAKPEDYPKQYVNSPEALYVLEITANKAREYGIYLGVKLGIPGQK